MKGAGLDDEFPADVEMETEQTDRMPVLLACRDGRRAGPPPPSAASARAGKRAAGCPGSGTAPGRRCCTEGSPPPSISPASAARSTAWRSVLEDIGLHDLHVAAAGKFLLAAGGPAAGPARWPGPAPLLRQKPGQRASSRPDLQDPGIRLPCRPARRSGRGHFGRSGNSGPATFSAAASPSRQSLHPFRQTIKRPDGKCIEIEPAGNAVLQVKIARNGDHGGIVGAEQRGRDMRAQVPGSRQAAPSPGAARCCRPPRRPPPPF